MDVRVVQVLALGLGVYYLAFCLSLAGGALVRSRSPGALDDGAAVAVLLRLAESLQQGQVRLARTDVRIVFFAGEEAGLQGSHAYVRENLPSPRDRTYFINAEGLGAGSNLRYFTSDRSVLRRRDASSELMRWLDAASRRTHGRGIAPDTLPVTTDASSFLAAGIPSITIGSYRGNQRITRGLHSSADAPARIDLPSLERALRFYEETLRTIDRS